MKTLVGLIMSELNAGRAAALVTVLSRKGSAPRGAGACMLICGDGSAHGTVGGGALEHAALVKADECLQNKRSELLRYSLTPDDAASVGMVCGGEVLLHCWYIDNEMLPLFGDIEARIRDGRDAWLELAINADASVSAARVIDASPYSQATLIEDGDGFIFTEPITASSRAYIFGGGHIAVELAPLLSHIDFDTVVFDDREEFANAERFPSASRVVLGDFNSISRYVSISERDYIVIMTRGHSYDHALLTQALRTSAAYIGLIGSRSKIERTKSLLLDDGFGESDFMRVHTPIGLPILAETPAEIAVSIAAEMILHRQRLMRGLFQND